MKPPVALDSVTVPAHARVRSIGTDVGAVVPWKATGATLGTTPEAGTYVASNPAAFTDPSDENVTYSWPLGDVTDMPDREPVMVSVSADDDVLEVPEYTLTKS